MLDLPGFLALPGHHGVLGVETPLASSDLRQTLAGGFGLVHLHPDPADGVVGPVAQLLDDVLMAALQRQLGTEP